MEENHFIGTATLTVADDFNLKTYLKEVVKLGKKEKEESLKDGLAAADLSSYVIQSESTVFVVCNTGEANANIEVWNWLTNQFVKIMTCKLAEILSVVIDVEEGVDSDVSFLDKDGRFVFSDELISMYDPAALEEEIPPSPAANTKAPGEN